LDVSAIPSGILLKLERVYAETKVVWNGWPRDFGKFVRDSLDWDATPGWPWKKHYPTNRDLFLFDGFNVDATRLAMVEYAVKMRWNELLDRPAADPIFVFNKPEPHKVSKAEKKAWRLISGVGLTDTLVDRILYGQWLDRMIERWIAIPSKAGWSPQRGGFMWLAKAFRGKLPVSIDKSAWDWTVNEWHVSLMRDLVPRMLFGITDDWRRVFSNRFKAMYWAGYPVFKQSCGCESVQLVTGIQKSGCLGTIAFNSIWQVASHLAAGGVETDLIFSLGDDTVQEKVPDIEDYLARLEKTGAIVKEVAEGFPIVFGGHEFDEKRCVPTYRAKHMFALLHLTEDPSIAESTMTSYRHLYALDDEVGPMLEEISLRQFGPSNLLSREYLRDWYLSLE